MIVWCSSLLGCAVIVFGALVIQSQYGEQNLSNAVALPMNSCYSRCMRSNEPAYSCFEMCSSIKKRSVGGECNFRDWSIFSHDKKSPGSARLCVEFELDESRKRYKKINLSWSVSTEWNISNNSSNVADVQGFFIQWKPYGELNNECQSLPKNANFFILNSSLIPAEKMSCDKPIHLAVLVLPLTIMGVVKLDKFYCPINNASNPPCKRKTYTPKAYTYAVVKASETTQSTSKSIPQKYGGTPSMNVKCASVCKYTVAACSVAVMIAIVVIIILLRTRRLPLPCPRGSEQESMAVINTSNKDFCYVSYFSEDGSPGGPSARSVINFLINSRVRAVAIDALAKEDLQHYYSLGPRRFSEMYLKKARCVAVIITKKYFDLFSVHSTAELDKENRRVSEEIKCIAYAQAEVPRGDTPPFKKNNEDAKELEVIQPTFHQTAFENKDVEKRFFAILLDPFVPAKLPPWMQGWPMFTWPKERSSVLHYIGMVV